MAEQIKETDTLNQGRVKINAAIDLANSSSEKVNEYESTLNKGVADAKQIASEAGDEAKQIAENAGSEANKKADQALSNSTTAVNTANQALSRANQNKQEFDALENEFQELVAESGDSNPEIVQARTDTQGIKQTTLQARLTKDFGERMTTADAIQMFSGSINTPSMMDFVGKTAGNTLSNPHVAYSDYTATSLKKPSATWDELSQDNYNKLAGRDDSGVSTGSTQNGVIPQQRVEFDVLEAVKQLVPNIFTGLSVEESVQFVKDNFVSFSLSIRGKASSPNNKILKVATFLESTDSYTTQIQETALEYTDFKIDINDNNFIGDQGKLNLLIYSDSSNGVTASMIDIDYVGVQLTISLNPLDVLETSGFAKKEDIQTAVNPLASKQELNDHTANKSNPHNVTKAQLGLNLVENYEVASQQDAEQGIAQNKYMTPQRVAQQTDSRIATDDEAKLGTSNSKLMTPKTTKAFVDSMMITQKYVTGDLSEVKSGEIYLTRIGDMVTMHGSVATLDNADASNNKVFTPITFPEGFHPTSDVAVSHYVPAMFDVFFGSVTAGGILKLKVAMNNSHNHNISASWTTADEFPR